MKILFGIMTGIVLGALGVTAWVVFMPLVGSSSHQAAAQSEERADVEVALSDGFLTRQMQQELQGVDLPAQLSDLRIETEEGNRIIVRFVISAYGQSVDGAIVMAARVADGALSMEVVETDVGELPLPAALGKPLEKQINQRVGELLNGTSYRVVGARTTTGSLIVSVQEIS